MTARRFKVPAKTKKPKLIGGVLFPDTVYLSKAGEGNG